MNNKIGISTGVYFKTFGEHELDLIISEIKKIDPDIIEILFARPHMIDTTFSKENKKYLQRKELIIHAPFFVNIGYEDVQYTEEMLEFLQKKSLEMHAKHIILHPDLLAHNQLTKFANSVFVFENLKEKRHYTLNVLSTLIEKGLKIKLSVDIGHLESKSEIEIIDMLQKIEEDIVEIQMCNKAIYDDFRKGDTKKYEYLKNFNIPIILENRPENINELKEHYDRIKKFFSEK